MRAISLGAELLTGKNPVQHPVDAIQRRAAGAAGQDDGGAVADPAEADQVAGIDRHAEMRDLAPCRDDGGGRDVQPVGHRRGAGDEDEFRPRRHQFADGLGDGRGLMRALQRREQNTAARGDAGAGHLDGLRDHRGFELRQGGEDQPHRERPERCEGDGGVGAGEQGFGRVHGGGGDREGNDFQRGDEIARRHHRMIRQGRQRQGFVDHVEGVEFCLVQPQQAGMIRDQIDPAMEILRAAQERAEQQTAKMAGGFALRHVAGLQPGDGHFLKPRLT